MFQEPRHTNYDLNFEMFGIPVRIHWGFWLVSAILGVGSLSEKINLPSVLIWVIVVFVSVLVHELGHVLAYRHYGTDGKIVLYWMGGLAIRKENYSSSYYSGRESSSRAQIMISLAGPAAGLSLFLLVTAIVTLAGRGDFIAAQSLHIFGVDSSLLGISYRGPLMSDRLTDLVFFLISVNLLWSLVNLLPVYPLDGGQISREVCQMKRPHGGLELSLQISMFTGIAMAVFGLFWSERLLVPLLFGSLAYSSYQALQAYRGQGGGGYGGGGGWG